MKKKRKTQSERHTEISRRVGRKERLGVTQHTTIIRGMRTTAKMRNGGEKTGNPLQRKYYKNICSDTSRTL